MVEGGSRASQEVWGDSAKSATGSAFDVPLTSGSGLEARSQLSRDYANLINPASAPEEPVTRALSREITEHKRQLDQQTYLEKAVSFITEPFHGSSTSLAKMEDLQRRASEGMTPELNKEIKAAISKDYSALNLQSEISTYGTGMVQTAGLFLGGRKGLAYTAAAFAASSAKPSDAAGTQALDMTLGASKGLVMRGIFQGISRSSLDIPTKALGMGGSARFTDALMTRSTYLDPQGNLDVTGGLGKVASRTLDPTYVATDLLVFGGGQAIMANPSMRSFIQGSALRATMTTAGAFGLASGGAEETKRQLSTGEDLDFGKIATRAFLRSGTDAIASIPGGLQASRMAAMQRAEQLGIRRTGSEAAAMVAEPANIARTIKENIGNAKPNIPGANSREFQIVGGDKSGLDLLSKSRTASAILDVREVAPSGSMTGPTRKLLVQHVDEATPIRSRLAATVDLVASCNANLCGPMQGKHLFPESSGSLYFSRLANRITFGTDRSALATAGGAPVELGSSRSVSELFRATDGKSLRVHRNMETLAREMQHFKDPALRIVDGGADSVVVELADGRILKITDRPYRKEGQPLWRPEWGTRTYETENGVFRFDAKLLTKPQEIDLKGDPALYYIQERARTPVSRNTLDWFHDNINRDGRYVFWDGDSSFGTAQLGYVKSPSGRSGVVLLDYDAVRRPQDVPKDSPRSPGSGSHWLDRYRGDRADWD